MQPLTDLGFYQCAFDNIGVGFRAVGIVGCRRQVKAFFDLSGLDGPAEIDMTKVTYVDSTALHELASLKACFNGHLITMRVRENICRVLYLMRFDRLFEIVVIGSEVGPKRQGKRMRLTNDAI